ncbi:MAG: hypothetical protein ACO1O4_17675 [Devosia sp.]
MAWMTWELGNYLYFIPTILVLVAWNRKSLIIFFSLGLAVLTYPFLMPILGDTSIQPGSGGYSGTVSWILWLVAAVLFVLSTIGKVFRIWSDFRLGRRRTDS